MTASRRRTTAGRRRWWIAAALVALTALAAGLAQAVLAAGSAPAPWPGDDGYLGWPERGDRAGDRAQISAAVVAWDASTDERHSDVRTLYAGADPLLGAVTVFEGRTRAGGLRLAIVAEPTQLGASGALLLNDRAAPEPSTTRQVSLVTRRLPAISGDGALVLALVEPQAQITGVSSWAWDSYGSFAPRELAAVVVPAAATAGNVSLTVERDGAVIYAGPLDSTPESRSGAHVGAARVQGLPAGAAAQPVVDERVGDTRTIARSFTGGAAGTLRVAEVHEPGLTLEGLTARVAPGARTAAANPRDHTSMSELIGTGVRGFVWLQRPGVGYAVLGYGDREVAIDAYHVAHAIELP